MRCTRSRAALARVAVRGAGVAALLLAASLAVVGSRSGDPSTGATVSSGVAERDSYAERRDAALSRDAERTPLAQTRPELAQELGRERNRAAELIKARAVARSRELAANTWVTPLTSYRLTGQFGASSSLWSSSHTGLDFAAASGTPIRSVSRGVVTESGMAGAYGLRTVIVASDGTVIWYCHQQSTLVAPGTSVAAGDQIGEVGATGNVTGSHLHLEVRPNGAAPVDPSTALRERGAAV